ncbi:hypothetical protein GCM10012287_20170 [Streptomyces daqingensis]|uniref:Uncharacterized protein n=1 Tax=Streptomyces daqingensis TaxID=1472640 RepID=A0ABQ2M6T8_9ACTN|nr:hypothetical protein GCM10012287_20170 [Streptomyces daqingensis]
MAAGGAGGHARMRRGRARGRADAPVKPAQAGRTQDAYRDAGLLDGDPVPIDDMVR